MNSKESYRENAYQQRVFGETRTYKPRVSGIIPTSVPSLVSGVAPMPSPQSAPAPAPQKR